MIFLCGVLAFVIALLFSRWLSAARSPSKLLDLPNQRSLHQQPTPRTGGLAIFTAILIAGASMLVGSPPEDGWFWLPIGLLVIAAVSFIDDLEHVPPAYRLAAHAVGAGLLLNTGYLSVGEWLPGLDPSLPVWIEIPCALLFVVWMTNLYNFMDGMDGFAGGMAMIGFGTLALFGLLAANPLFATMNLIVAGASSGFLVVNFPPARLFMGDLGASSLGFLAAAFALWGDKAQILPLWASLLLFSPFVVDASVTLIRRLSKGEKVWQAHCSHYYQRLVRLGWGHRRTVLWEYGLMVACALTAIGFRSAGTQVQWLVLGFWLLLYALLMIAVASLERRSINC